MWKRNIQFDKGRPKSITYESMCKLFLIQQVGHFNYQRFGVLFPVSSPMREACKSRRVGPHLAQFGESPVCWNHYLGYPTMYYISRSSNVIELNLYTTCNVKRNLGTYKLPAR